MADVRRLDARLDKLDTQLDDLAIGLKQANASLDESDEKLNLIQNAIAEYVQPLENGHQDHGRRISRLEQQAA